MTQTSFTITNGEGSAATTNTDTTSLNGAIRSIDVGGSNAATSTNYTITLTASITLSAADLLAINLPTGSSLTIVGGTGISINGNGNQRGLFVYSGNVTVQDLTITNAQALGGAGASAGERQDADHQRRHYRSERQWRHRRQCRLRQRDRQRRRHRRAQRRQHLYRRHHHIRRRHL